MTNKAGRTYTRYESFIDRRDPAIGEYTDELTDRLDHRPKKRSLAVVVELEPVIKQINGRNKPAGFSIKTEDFVRVNDEGDTEEAIAPIIGIVTQSKHNFFVHLATFDEENAPIEDTPFQVTRIGKDTNTTYNFVPFEGLEVDYSNLKEHYRNVGYLRDFEIDAEDDRSFGVSLGAKFLDKRLEELADKHRYDSLVGTIDHIENRFGSSKPKEKKVSTPSFDDMIPSDEESKVQRVRRQYAKA